MGNDWFERTKLAAYYLWEHTEKYGISVSGNTLDLWYAVEDIAAFLEHANILSRDMVDGIVLLGPGSEGYIWFVRNLAYRLHIYTTNPNTLDNWFMVEQLLASKEWVENITAMATMINQDSENVAKQVRSDMVRSFYGIIGHLYGTQTFD